MWASGRRGLITYNRGVVVAADFFAPISLTADSTDRELDISGIVPVGTKFVEVTLNISAQLDGSVFIMRPNGAGENMNQFTYAEQNQLTISYRRFWLPVGVGGNLEYWLQTGTWMQVFVTITAWKK